MRYIDLSETKPRLERVDAGDKRCHHVFVVDIRGDTDTMKCKHCPALRLVHHKRVKAPAQINFSRIFYKKFG